MSEAKRALESENARLKKFFANAMLDNAMGAVARVVGIRVA